MPTSWRESWLLKLRMVVWCDSFPSLGSSMSALSECPLTTLGTNLTFARFELDPRWSDTGDRYILKLFRDYVFHSVDISGKPVLDLSHVLTCLNKVCPLSTTLLA